MVAARISWIGHGGRWTEVRRAASATPVSPQSIPTGSQWSRRMPKAHRWQITHPALMLPLGVYLLAFYGYPVVTMLVRSVAEPHWTFDNFRRVFDDAVYVQVLWITLRVSIVVTVA